MKAFKIKQNLYWTGVLDPELRVFDIIMETRYGTSYNSYLLEGSEKTALFETAKEAFFDEMVGYIESVASVSEIDYLIMDEASQVDIAAGALALSCAKNAVIVGDLKQLPNVVDRPSPTE